MMLEDRGHAYPPQAIEVIEFPAELSSIFPKPVGQVEDSWPPLQLSYLGNYVADLGGKTVVVEGHYIDRDYIDDVALFYARSLRAYPNYCYRLHFFATPFDQAHWRSLVTETDPGRRDENCRFLQEAYLGFTVVRPLAGAPIGRRRRRANARRSTASGSNGKYTPGRGSWKPRCWPKTKSPRPPDPAPRHARQGG